MCGGRTLRITEVEGEHGAGRSLHVSGGLTLPCFSLMLAFLLAPVLQHLSPGIGKASASFICLWVFGDNPHFLSVCLSFPTFKRGDWKSVPLRLVYEWLYGPTHWAKQSVIKHAFVQSSCGVTHMGKLSPETGKMSHLTLRR
jgi:hypothetical protein